MAVALVAASATATTLPAQQSRSVEVRDRGTATVVSAASISLANGVAIGRTGSDGRLAIGNTRHGDTLHVRAIGFVPTVAVVDTAVALLVVQLDRSVVLLSDLVTVTSDALVRSGASEWSVGGDATRVTPFAGEPDAFRALALVPAVSFSSLLSARPMIRGIDAAGSGFTIDGHEAINLYHVGRFFSAFPALGVGSLDVAAQPARLDIGRTTSGQIGISGAEWHAGRRTELQYGLGAWSAATGWQAAGHSGILVGRTVEGALAGAADDGSDVSLSIGDIYGRFDLGAERRTSFTLYRSVDRIVDRKPEDGPPGNTAGLDWGNLLLGARSELVRSSTASLTFRGSYASHFETGSGIPGRETITQVENRVRRITAGFDGSAMVSGSGIGVEGGIEVGQRDVINRLDPDDPTRIPTTDLDFSATELAGHIGLAIPAAGGTLRVGVRADALGDVVAWQPRLAFAAPLDDRWWISAGMGRAARTMHLISDARTEPKVAYYDVWLPTDGDSTDAATVDHFAAELGWSDGRHTVRAGVFAASGSGAMEFVPENQSIVTGLLLRAGDLRVRGGEIEARTASLDGRWAGQVSYTMQWSERDWGDGWLPWVNDRRHLLRLAAIYRPRERTTISVGAEAGSGQPYIPLIGIDSTPTGLRNRYGAENSARGRAGLRIDAAIQREFAGPLGTDLSLGLSVMNIALGDQSPRKGSLRFIPSQPGGPTLGAVPASEELFRLPPIPTLLIRVRF